ncbi:MAG TPA: hypothetical protein VMZ73_09835 [Acidimicrobiales bacterium]|nr:hypothetical protein [Acidimicrobiales bacterium]
MARPTPKPVTLTSAGQFTLVPTARVRGGSEAKGASVAGPGPTSGGSLPAGAVVVAAGAVVVVEDLSGTGLVVVGARVVVAAVLVVDGGRVVVVAGAVVVDEVVATVVVVVVVVGLVGSSCALPRTGRAAANEAMAVATSRPRRTEDDGIGRGRK